MHHDDRAQHSKYWSDDVGQRSPGERGYEDYRGGGEHVGGFYGQESSFGREQHGGRDRGRSRGGDRFREEERPGYDRWAGPERGRQGYPGSMAERFGPGAYDRERIEGQGFGRGDLERQDYGRRELGRQEYERRGYGGQLGANQLGGNQFGGGDREPDRRYGQDRGRQYGEQGYDQGGYGFQSPEQRAYDQGRSRGRGYDEDRYGPGFYDRDRRTDQSFEGRAGGGRDWNERPNRYGQEHYGGSASDEDYGFHQGYRQPEHYQAPTFRDERGRGGDERGGFRRGDADRWRGERSGNQGRYQDHEQIRHAWDQEGWSGSGRQESYGQGQGFRQGYANQGGHDQGQYGRQGDDMRRYGQPGDARDQGWSDGGWRDEWRSAGSYAGRGPRGYQRSDDRIRDEVCEALTRHPDIDASDVEIDVRGGEVTLRGMVDSRRTRRLAEDVIEDLPGVRDVHNELRSADRMRGSEGVPSRSGASGSDTGKVEVTGDEVGSPHATPSARDANPGSTPIGHTYGGAGEGAGMMGTGTAGGGQVGASGAVGADRETVSGADSGGMLSGGSGAVGTTGGATAGTRGSSRASGTGGRAQSGTAGSGWRLRETMTVIGSDGEDVGQVKEVRDDELLVDRPTHRGLWVPHGAIRTVDGERVMLACAAGDVDNQGWRMSDLLGSESDSGTTRSRRSR